jgi:glucose-6-phosphate isomerase
LWIEPCSYWEGKRKGTPTALTLTLSQGERGQTFRLSLWERPAEGRVRAKRLLSGKVSVMASYTLSPNRWQEPANRTIKELQSKSAVKRVWDRDPTLWKSEPEHQREISQRLGWLTVMDTMREQVDEMVAFRNELSEAGIQNVVLCGMGGSSLCPEVLRITFGSAQGCPRLWVLDSTDPTMISRVAAEATPERSLYLISSKSGGTIEVDSLFRFFYGKAQERLGERAGSAFAAVTDPGTGLEKLARERGFRHIFINPPDIGGRYSALSLFGLAPSAMIGLDVSLLLDRAEAMAHACGPSTPAEENPGLWLGAVMATMATSGRDKLTLLASPRLAATGLWIEQLIAESTGKEGKGIVPVAGEPPSAPDLYGRDRFFVYSRLEGDDNAGLDQLVAELEGAGHPVATLALADPYDLAGEFFRWEFATAIVGAVLKIDPFDQPNVQESKDNTGRLLAVYRESGKLPEEQPGLVDGDLKLYGTGESKLDDALTEFLKQGRPGDYIAVMAYLDMDETVDRALVQVRRKILDRTGLATTLGYGPRFLHSTGQLHKGGPNRGLFLQITSEDRVSLPIPEQPYDFATLKAAQALGDRQALRQHGRRVLSVDLGADVLPSLSRLSDTLG